MVHIPKANIKLPITNPPPFNGTHLDYIQWRRLWKDTMSYYQDAVQLIQLKQAIPDRTQGLIGLSDIRTTAAFWSAIK